MSSFPRLPPECILLIAEQLLLCRDYTTLSSLLLISKTMLTLVAPIAFGEPFGSFNNKIDFLPIGGQPPGRKLCRTLLSSRPVEQLPKLLQLVYFPEYSAQECGEYDPTPPLHFDYSLYVRHLHFSVAMPLHPDFSLRQASKQVLPLEEQIVPEITKDVELYLAKDDHVLPKRLRRLYPYSLLLDAHLRVVLTWTLCEPILERIRSIDIPLSDIDRYLSVVHRFRSLSSINFIDDFAMDCPEGSLSKWAQLDLGRAPAIAGLRDTAIDNMIQFIEEARLHGYQVFRVDFQRHDVNQVYRTRPSKWIMERIARALPPLDHPRRLDESNWTQLAKHVDSTCLDHVRRIATPSACTWHSDLVEVGPVWSQCRSLEELRLIFYPTPVSFHWAVKEKNKHHHSLPPLRRIVICQYIDAPILAIDDLAVAFSDTLEDIKYDCSSFNMEPIDEPSFGLFPDRTTLTAGYQWVMMPALKNISIVTGMHDLVLDPAWLQLCPALQCIILHSKRRDFDPATRIWDEPAQLPDLRTIMMIGRAAQGFNMDTFASTRLLKSIELAVSDAGQKMLFHDDAPRYDYDRRLPNAPHQWSWDWDLPCLSSLSLGAGFANLFEFRMLDGSPALMSLTLVMAGSDVPCAGRQVREAELVSRHGTTSGYISCPRLMHLTLQGRFTLAPEVLHVLFTHVMPSLKQVHACACRGHGVEDWVREVQRLEDLGSARTDLFELSEAEMEALGLKQYGSGYTLQGEEDKNTAMYYFEKANVMRH